jgi:hypothetical protein
MELSKRIRFAFRIAKAYKKEPDREIRKKINVIEKAVARIQTHSLLIANPMRLPLHHPHLKSRLSF